MPMIQVLVYHAISSPRMSTGLWKLLENLDAGMFGMNTGESFPKRQEICSATC